MIFLELNDKRFINGKKYYCYNDKKYYNYYDLFVYQFKRLPKMIEKIYDKDILKETIKRIKNEK